MNIGLYSKLDAIVTLIKSGETVKTTKLCSLIDANVVKLQVNKMSILSYYLETSPIIRCDEVETFVDNGADVNARDSKGRTPLHWFVGHDHQSWSGTISGDNMLENMNLNATVSTKRLIPYLISKGANPCLLDNDGNNVLMLAIIYDQPQILIEPILKSSCVNSQLMNQKNNLGFSALDLYFRSEHRSNGIPLSRLVALNPDPTAVDHHGNNCLHNLFLRPVQRYIPKVDYNARNAKVPKLDRSTWLFMSTSRLVYELQMITGTLEVDITQKNNDGLIPLQVALIKGLLDGFDRRDLCFLVPVDETVLQELVPEDPIRNKFSLANKVWFVARLSRDAMLRSRTSIRYIYAPDQFTNLSFIEHLMANGAVTTPSDIIMAIKWNSYTEYSVLSERVRKDQIVNIDDDSREMLVQTILLNGCLPGVISVLITKGLQLRAQDFKNVTSGEAIQALDTFADYFTPELVVELNAQSPNLLERLILNTTLYETSKLIEKLARLGVEVTVGCFTNAFNTGSPLAIQILIKYTGEKVKVHFKRSVSNANQKLFNMYSDYRANCASSKISVFSDCIKFVADCGIAITTGDLKNALALDGPFFLHMFLRHTNLAYGRANIRFPNILICVLDQCAREDIHYGSWLADLVKVLLEWFDVNINYVDSSLGTALHILVTLFAKWPQYSQVFWKILHNFLEQKQLDIDKVHVFRSDHSQPKTARIESSPLQLALDHGLIHVVNYLLFQGANCHGLDVIGLSKGKVGAATTFSILCTLGYQVELSQFYVDYETEAYAMEREQLSKWWQLESRRLKTLKELTAMRVKRDLTRLELNAFMTTVEIRP